MAGYITGKGSDPFLKFWIKIEDKKGAKERADKVLKYIRKYHPQTRTVLELACGLGQVLVHFPKKYELYGLDIGKEYVNYAKKRLKNKNIYVSSMHNFKIKRKFDAIFCVFDSIHFLENFKQWKQCFSTVAQHLKPKGLFIFDTYTPYALIDLGKYKSGFWKEPAGYYIADIPIIKGNNLTWDYKIFEEVGQGKYKLNQYYFPEKLFAPRQIENALRAHFKILEKKDTQTLKKIKKKTMKVLYIARKK